MDTGSKNFNFTAVKKLIAVFLCLVSVTVIANQTVTSFVKADEQNLTWTNARDALVSYFEDGEVWSTLSFSNNFNNYILSLSSFVGNYGDGSEEAYKEKTDYITSYNKEIKKQAKKNLVRYLQAKNVCYEYLVAEANDVVTTLEKIGDADELSCYDYDIDALNSDNLDYDYIAHGEFNRNSLVLYAEIEEAAAALNADGIVKLDYTCSIYEDYYDSTAGHIKTYEAGYYAFKINDSALYDKLYEIGTLIQTDQLSYEMFKSDYENKLKEIKQYYDTGRYYIKDSSGRVYTNMKNLSASSTSAQIETSFMALDFYCIEHQEAMFTPEGKVYTYNKIFENENVNYYSLHAEDTTKVSVEKTEPLTTSKPSYNDNEITETTVIDISYGEEATTSFVNAVPYYDATPFTSSGNFICYVGVDLKDTAVSEDDSFISVAANVGLAKIIVQDFMVTCGILAVQFVLCFIYLIIKSGRRKLSDKKVYLLKTDKIFSEIRIAFNGAVICLALACIDVIVSELNLASDLGRSLLSLCCALLTVAILDLILFVTRHIKNKSFFSNFFVVWIVKTFLSKIKTSVGKIKTKLIYVSDLQKVVKTKTGIIVAINIIVGFFALLFIDVNIYFSLLSILSLFLLELLILYRGIIFVGGVHKLFQVVAEMRKGNIEEEIKKEALPSYLLPHAENLQGLGEGLKVAVEEAVRQEQTKTELITNVSHDLKTPLTSIINYVDLLKKCDISDETALSYLQVLSEKSDRLKHLITDLVEASKASTGALPVTLVDMSLQELLKQLIGEFEEDFEKRGLKIIFDCPEGDITVKADCNHLYRVMENLFVNVKKYALENSRVYVSINSQDDKGVITLKNISAEALNIPAAELKNRFVRGDQSRTTEGNGLGLSIAENLCTLQGGNLILEINGDLFVAKIEMNKA